MLDERGAAAALKEAFKTFGYHVSFHEGTIFVRTAIWAFEIDEYCIPAKILAVIVEHIGQIPRIPAAYIVQKNRDPGTTCMLDDELNYLEKIRAMAEKAKTPIRRTGLWLDGHEIWQTRQGLKVRPMDPRYTRIIEAEALKTARVQMEDDRPGSYIAFKGFVGTAIVQGIEHRAEDGKLARIEDFPWLGEGGE